MTSFQGLSGWARPDPKKKPTGAVAEARLHKPPAPSWDRPHQRVEEDRSCAVKNGGESGRHFPTKRSAGAGAGVTSRTTFADAL